MGKRKSSAKPPPKKEIAKIPKEFDCPFCSHKESVDCRIDRKSQTGSVCCRTCGESYTTNITSLSEPIDIYTEWLDEAIRVNK